MPIPTTPLTKRLARWMLPHEQPADLALEHPAQVDIADAWEEIARLRKVLLSVKHGAEYPDELGDEIDAALSIRQPLI